MFKDHTGTKKKLYQCSHCTAGSVFTSVLPEQTCSKCKQVPVHMCSRCGVEFKSNPKTCYLCMERPHICLSKCRKGCVKRPSITCPLKCPCGKAKKFQSKKPNENCGRFFWTCNGCKFFAWE